MDVQTFKITDRQQRGKSKLNFRLNSSFVICSKSILYNKRPPFCHVASQCLREVSVVPQWALFRHPIILYGLLVCLIRSLLRRERGSF